MQYLIQECMRTFTYMYEYCHQIIPYKQWLEITFQTYLSNTNNVTIGLWSSLWHLSDWLVYNYDLRNKTSQLTQTGAPAQSRGNIT